MRLCLAKEKQRTCLLKNLHAAAFDGYSLIEYRRLFSHLTSLLLSIVFTHDSPHCSVLLTPTLPWMRLEMANVSVSMDFRSDPIGSNNRKIH